MPRMPRVVVPGLPLHVIQRGNNRQAIFFTDQDYDRFHTDLRTASERFDCVIHAYVYMTNHVLLLVTPSARQGISRMMQSVGRHYVRYINDVYNRSGTLWEGRFKSALVDSDIRERPASVEDRAVPGHWEGDLIAGSNNSYIATLVERHTRYVMLAKVLGKDTETVINALVKQARSLPKELY